ncbi:YesL family protein [Virgibacillus litoralis]|uniref:Membrane protein YesL n=1 Tax=Virgibacillus litoralis TaxID=578221 RepID=A0ABS4HC07_9BACI|nr:YesL family protein [Virgibacillus litoralis]MBP1948445.1 putative membrane protein YesL [Virgibacillus litoralis]
MTFGGWEKFNMAAFWMIKLAYINLLWILFTIGGLVIFGLFPATVAMFTVVRKWMRKESNFKIFPAFWTVFRTDFIKANGLGLLFITVGYILYYDFTFLQVNDGKLAYLLPVFIFILISYAVTLLFFFPVFVHFDLKFFQYIKQSFLVAITSPIETILSAVSIVLLYFAITLLPGIIPLFSGSLLAIAMTWTSFRAFRKIERRKGLT